MTHKLDLTQEEIDSADAKVHAVLIRHGQSEANAGKRTGAHYAVKLTEKGFHQSRELARFWKNEPSAIVYSPFIRTFETAFPTHFRFNKTPLVCWPVHEFTCINPLRARNTTDQERTVLIDKYWEKNDPDFRDLGGAESFADLWQRGSLVLDFLKPRSGRQIYSHDGFLKMINFRLLFPECVEPNAETMRKFRIFSLNTQIQNTARINIYKTLNGELEVGEPQISHLPEGMVTG